MALTTRYSTVLFDLDGTLTDPYEGIAACFRYALAGLGQPQPDEATLRAWIGPPLRETFQLLLADPELAERGVALYRERYEPIGAFENRVYPGIPELLADLRAAGCRIGLATSKLDSAAVSIVEHFGLAPYLDVLVGASRDGRLSAKADIIAVATAELGADPAATVMVGDREHDVLGARANGVACIGVAYGYGGPAELRGAGAAHVVETVAELRTLLL